MHAALLPLFPLEVILFPRTPLPLHIFEERYKEMIGEAIENNSEIGIVYTCEKGLMNTGCTGVVDRVVERYDDGRMDIIVAGRRRFEIQELDQERIFLRGEVEFFDDEDAEDVVPDELRDRVLQHYQEIQALSTSSSLLDPEVGGGQVSFQLAQVITDITMRQLMLVCRSEVERMRQLDTYLPSLIKERAEVARVKITASTNGHGKKPLGI